MDGTLTINEVWERCLEQWKHVVDTLEKWPLKYVNDIKREWVIEHFQRYVHNNCLFCDHVSEDHTCERCPGKVIDPGFSCTAVGYHYIFHPKKFYEKILELNAIRLTKLPSTKQALIERLEKLDFFGHPDFYTLLGDLADLHSRKNHDYAGTDNPLRNFHKSREQGVEPWRGVLVRLSDKWSRLESFCKQSELQVSNESFEDTLMDNAVYSLIAIILHREGSIVVAQTDGLSRVPHIRELVDQKESTDDTSRKEV